TRARLLGILQIHIADAEASQSAHGEAGQRAIRALRRRRAEARRDVAKAAECTQAVEREIETLVAPVVAEFGLGARRTAVAALGERPVDYPGAADFDCRADAGVAQSGGCFGVALHRQPVAHAIAIDA